MADQSVVTVATYDYLDRAIVMAESFVKYNCKTDIYILIADCSHKQVCKLSDTFIDGIKFIGIDKIEDGSVDDIIKYYNAFELCCALKAYAIKYLLQEKSYRKVIYLDSDTYCLNSFDEIFLLLDEHDVILTPHVNSHLPGDGCLPNDMEFLTCGHINGGFMGFRNTADSKDALDWLIDKVRSAGFYSLETGINADQGWLSALPWFFYEIVYICRHPGMNLAYWNLYEREIVYRNNIYKVNDSDVFFFHFSGYDPANKGKLTAYSNRPIGRASQDAISRLVHEYSYVLADIKGRIPKLKPDKKCSQDSINKRLKKYKKSKYCDRDVYRNIRRSMIYRLCNKIFNRLYR